MLPAAVTFRWFVDYVLAHTVPGLNMRSELCQKCNWHDMSPKPKLNFRRKCCGFWFFVSQLCPGQISKTRSQYWKYKAFHNLKSVLKSWKADLLRCVIPTSQHKPALLSSRSGVVPFAAIMKRGIRIILQSS